ncbi:hypothetical protein RF11_13462 [Thelohanellus kitauei]|uniref:Uncharacterized protein n=1 Tax=Thelohanellus kitauei TaxID=669202 RepID=A0A0C2MZB9_THEKT|nr:hypothetical protein RF11_13462 [Thelohanellus kitauei]
MTNACYKILFGVLESLIILSCLAFIYAFFIPSLFSICVGPQTDQTCIHFGVFHLSYKDQKIKYQETANIIIKMLDQQRNGSLARSEVYMTHKTSTQLLKFAYIDEVSSSMQGQCRSNAAECLDPHATPSEI